MTQFSFQVETRLIASLRMIVYLFFFVLWSATASAQTFPEKLEAHYAALTSWSADFEQTTYIEMLDQKALKTGKIAAKRPNRVRVEYFSEPNKIYTSDGKKLWVYKEAENTAWQFDKPQDVISKEAWSFLNGLSNMAQIFDVFESLPEPEGFLTIQDKKLKKVFLVPKQSDAVLKIVAGIDEKTMMIQEAVLYNTSGNVTHYQFKQISLNPVLDNALFTLPAQPKRKIIRK